MTFLLCNDSCFCVSLNFPLLFTSIPRYINLSTILILSPFKNHFPPFLKITILVFSILTVRMESNWSARHQLTQGPHFTTTRVSSVSSSLTWLFSCTSSFTYASSKGQFQMPKYTTQVNSRKNWITILSWLFQIQRPFPMTHKMYLTLSLVLFVL